MTKEDPSKPLLHLEDPHAQTTLCGEDGYGTSVNIKSYFKHAKFRIYYSWCSKCLAHEDLWAYEIQYSL